MDTSHPYLNRLITNKLLELFNNFPVVIVAGARQTGKSTLLAHVYPDIPSVVFDPIVDVENARKDPELFLSNREPPLILDEIQYAPELVPAIKRRVDKNKRVGQYLITGSQQWEVMRSLSESLAGRAVILNLDGLCLLEIAQMESQKGWLAKWLSDPGFFSSGKIEPMKSTFTAYEQLWRGFLPESQFLKKEVLPDYLSSYQKTYIERDIRQMAEVSDLQLFHRFFGIASAMSAQEINFSQIGREIGVTPQTASRWLSILSSTFQWFEIPPYSGNAIKRISGKPKGYINDTGMICLSQAISTPLVLGAHPMWGPVFETAVVKDICKQAGLVNGMPHFYHWRSHSGAEVDLLIEWEGCFYPIEIKGKTNPDRKDARGMEAFKSTYPKLKIRPGLIVALSDSFYPVAEDIFVMPWNASVKTA